MASDYVYSISNGNYFISSRDNFHLWAVIVQGIPIVVGIPQKDFNTNLLSFNVNLKPKVQYGNIKVNFQNKSYYLTYDAKNLNSNLILTSNLNDEKNQTFVFSTDGRIILPLYQPEIGIMNANSKLVTTTNLTRYVWKFSPFSPVPNGRISMWTENLYGQPLANLDQYFDKSSESSCNCSVSATCDNSYQTTMAVTSCQGRFATSPYCLKTIWPDKDKNNCCVGASSILTQNLDKPGKFDFNKCKILHNTQICDRTFTDTDINDRGTNQGVKVGSWFPFSKECSNNNDTINFCAQHDTLQNQPILFNNVNCRNWCQANSNECKISKQRYCEMYPFNPACIDWCNRSEISADTCRQILVDFCQGQNLETSVCNKLCNNLAGNCDKDILNYCQSLGTGAINHDICGCFMGGEFYDRYFAGLRAKGASSAIIPTLPECLYARCSSAPVQTHKFYDEIKGGVRPCPDIQQCINEVHVDAGGNIIGDITIIQENKCNFALRPQDCKVNEIITTTNRCTGCPDISIPDKDKKNCICYENQILKDGKCVCKDTFIMAGDKKSCVCPNTFILSPDKKSCVCPPGQIINKDGFCETPKPDDFTLELIDYIKKDLPINNEIDKNRVIINAPEMASNVVNSGCGINLQVAKECSNFIPFICSLQGAKDYCRDNSDDKEFCNADGTPKEIKTVYNFGCDKIIKPRKPECKINEYIDPLDNKCKACPIDMISTDKKTCKPIECKNNEYIDTQTFMCVKCNEGEIVAPDKHSCVSEFSLERKIRDYIKTITEYKNIDITALGIYNEEITRNILLNSECKLNFNNAKQCIDNLLLKCSENPNQNIYGFDCNKINKNVEPDKNKNLLFIILGVVGALVLIGILLKLRKKK
jgi:hypothetical protein